MSSPVATGCRPRLLIVDDDDNVRTTLQRVLSNDYDVTLAADGIEGLQALRSCEPFAVILSDLEMPNMNGLSLLREAVRVAPHTKRVLCTGTGDDAALVELVISTGLFCALYKPVTVASIRAALRDAVAAYNEETAARETRPLERAAL